MKTERNQYLFILCLKCIVLIQALGYGAKYLWVPLEQETEIFEYLLFDHSWNEEFVQFLDDLFIWLFVLSGLIVFLLKPEKLFRRLYQISLLYMASFLLFLSTIEMMRGSIFRHLIIPEHAVRIAAPLGLFILITFMGNLKKDGTRWFFTLVFFKVAAAVTFAVHGGKAVHEYGAFIDIIILSFENMFSIEVDQSLAEVALIVIGIVDILVAILLLFTKWKWVSLYMAFWGFLTAFSRMSSLGIEFYPEIMIRIANGGVPLVIFLYSLSVCKSNLDGDHPKENEAPKY